jgi:hypothetical protein
MLNQNETVYRTSCPGRWRCEPGTVGEEKMHFEGCILMSRSREVGAKSLKFNN